jgi:preprotein translocase SecE subunit
MRIKKYFKEVAREARRVRWPKRDQMIPALFAVIGVTLFAVLFLMLEDWGSATLLQQLRNAFSAMKR